MVAVDMPADSKIQRRVCRQVILAVDKPESDWVWFELTLVTEMGNLFSQNCHLWVLRRGSQRSRWKQFPPLIPTQKVQNYFFLKLVLNSKMLKKRIKMKNEHVMRQRTKFLWGCGNLTLGSFQLTICQGNRNKTMLRAIQSDVVFETWCSLEITLMLSFPSFFFLIICFSCSQWILMIALIFLLLLSYCCKTN